MSLKNSYAIWNNKGGVGKSTIAFHVSSRYAQKHPEEKVLVIDLCPQANSSMMLLGGGTDGEDTVLKFCTKKTPNTVVGYLSLVLTAGQGAKLPQNSKFLSNVKKYNGEMPDNLFLLSGDGNLEPMAPLISAQANLPALTPSSNPWKWVHEIFLKMIEELSSNSEETWTVFIDCCVARPMTVAVAS